ncbi:MAG: peptide-methionine (S)-S-oxide reductase MsrA [Deltaproteobacteria bacterium]|jgi:methionine-S-sulfoxide reductase|nr:peptide-methionine (S)-S-oxide reductase MsrA [Deltaproteobacteria bacterium]
MLKEIYLAGGCFWGVEKYFSLVNGVVETAVGYANGRTANPTYAEVCAGRAGHAETVMVRYDPQVISLTALLELYFEVIDPLAVNRQGADVGRQYRTGIYFTDGREKQIISRALDALQRGLDAPVAVEAVPLDNFYLAEELHQQYLNKNPGGYCHIRKEKFQQARDYSRK